MSSSIILDVIQNRPLFRGKDLLSAAKIFSAAQIISYIEVLRLTKRLGISIKL